MNVLIVGGYSYIGINIGKYLNKKGYRILILDTETDSEDIGFRYRFYDYSRISQIKKMVDEKKISYIIYVNVACIRHLSRDGSLNSLRDILSFVSADSGLKFIFLSHFNGYNFDTIGGDLKEYNGIKCIDDIREMLYENLCLKYRDEQGMNLSILRISFPYGPKCYTNIIYNLVNRPWRINFYDGSSIMDEYYDFIHVDDLVSAVYKTMTADENYVLNICSGISYNMADIRNIILRMKYNEIDNVENYARSMGRRILNNSKAEQSIGWTPGINIVRGIEGVKDDNVYGEEKIPGIVISIYDTIATKLQGISKISPYIINVMAAFIIFVVVFILKGADIHLNFDYRALYVCYITVIFGFKQGILASLLSILGIAAGVNGPGYDVTGYILKGTDYLLVTFICSFIRNFYIIKRKKLQKQVDDAKDELLRIGKKYEEVKDENIKIQKGKALGEETFAKIYTMTRLLNTLDRDEIMNGTIETVHRFLNTGNVLIFKVNESKTYLRLIAACGENAEQWNKRKSFIINGYKEMRTVIREKRTYVNKHINSEMPAIMSPIIDKDNVIYVLGVYDLDFASLNIYSRNTMSMIANMISCYIHSARKYEKAKWREMYVDGTEVLKFKYFRNKIEQKYYLKAKENVPYTILKIDKESGRLDEMYNRAKDIVRNTDFFGTDFKDNLYVILENTDENEALSVIRRFKMFGIEAEVINDTNLIGFSEDYFNMSPVREATISIINSDDWE